MRIIAGQLKGLNFNAPTGHKTHPMSDKMRGSLFNILGDLNGLSFLDVFSGSGALSIEAISRGAASAEAIEADSRAAKIIRANLAKLNLTEHIKVSEAFVRSWLKTKPNRSFDIILADPPYHDLQTATIAKLVDHINPSGLLVLSWPSSEPIVEFSGVKIIKNKQYGDAQLVFYRKIS